MGFPCTYCDIVFTRIDNMKRHLKQAHGNKTVIDGCSPLQHPFTSLLVGPSGSGKTRWIQKLLQSQLVEPKPSRIMWCYSQWQAIYDQILEEFAHVDFVKGLPIDITEQWDPQIPNLLILDDLMTQMDERVAELYVRGSHHLNLSVITVLQNLFPKGKDPRTVSLNSHYVVLMKNPRDCLQVATLGAQMFPGHGRKLVTAYREATKQPYSYLLIDFKQGTPDHCRLRTNLFETKQYEPTEKHARATSKTQPPNEKLHVSARAQELLQLLKPKLLTSNNHNEMIVQGRTVKGSNLPELLEYSVSPDGDAPMGWNEFLKALNLHKSRLIALSLPEVTGGDIIRELSPIVQRAADEIICQVRPELLAWDKYNAAHLMGSVVPESNIVALFKFVLGHESKEPIGLIEFIKALKAGKVSRDLLVNRRAVDIYKSV